MTPHQVNALFTILALDSGMLGGLLVMMFVRLITGK